MPGERQDEVSREVVELAARQTPFPVTVASLRFLGQGTAYVIESPRLQQIRAEMVDRWAAYLTPQDAQGFRPHVTIQNKSAAAAAKLLFASLSASFTPFGAMSTGLLLWRYRQGPWEAAGEYAFAGIGLGPPSNEGS